MRDEDHMREKIEIALEQRQIALLAVAALIVFAVVFAAGVQVGRQIAGNAAAAPVQPPPDDLPAIDRAQEEGASGAAAKVAPRQPPARAELPLMKLDGPPPEPVAAPEPPVHAEVQKPPGGEAKLTPPPKELAAFTVQIGASQDKRDAKRLESKARAAGLKPYSVEADLGQKGLWYRVRVGSFASKDVAQRYKKDVERELRVSAVVMSTQ